MKNKLLIISLIVGCLFLLHCTGAVLLKHQMLAPVSSMNNLSEEELALAKEKLAYLRSFSSLSETAFNNAYEEAFNYLRLYKMSSFTRISRQLSQNGPSEPLARKISMIYKEVLSLAVQLAEIKEIYLSKRDISPGQSIMLTVTGSISRGIDASLDADVDYVLLPVDSVDEPFCRNVEEHLLEKFKLLGFNEDEFALQIIVEEQTIPGLSQLFIPELTSLWNMGIDMEVFNPHEHALKLSYLSDLQFVYGNEAVFKDAVEPIRNGVYRRRNQIFSDPKKAKATYYLPEVVFEDVKLKGLQALTTYFKRDHIESSPKMKSRLPSLMEKESNPQDRSMFNMKEVVLISFKSFLYAMRFQYQIKENDPLVVLDILEKKGLLAHSDRLEMESLFWYFLGIKYEIEKVRSFYDYRKYPASRYVLTPRLLADIGVDERVVAKKAQTFISLLMSHKDNVQQSSMATSSLSTDVNSELILTAA